MSDAKQAASGVDANQLAPDTGKPLSGVDKARFMVGFIIFGIMWMASGTIGSAVLLPERFNHLGIGTPEVILTSMNSSASSSLWWRTSSLARFQTDVTHVSGSALPSSSSVASSADSPSGSPRRRQLSSPSLPGGRFCKLASTACWLLRWRCWPTASPSTRVERSAPSTAAAPSWASP